jgi:hypothetical protein
MKRNTHAEGLDGPGAANLGSKDPPMAPQTGRGDLPKAPVIGDGWTCVAEAASPSLSNSAETGMTEGGGGGGGAA